VTLAAPPRFSLAAREAGHLRLASDQGDAAHIFVLEADIIRVLVRLGRTHQFWRDDHLDGLR
jgi:hypothetical protein